MLMLSNPPAAKQNRPVTALSNACTVEPEDIGVYMMEGGNPINRVDPLGLSQIIVYDTKDSGAGGHAAVVIDNPAAAGLTGSFPSGKAVLSWQGADQGVIAEKIGDIRVYDYNEYLKASPRDIDIYVWDFGGIDESKIVDAARKNKAWAADMKNNCAAASIKTLQDADNASANSQTAKIITDLGEARTPEHIIKMLGKENAKILGGSGSGRGSSSSGSFGSSTGSSSRSSGSPSSGSPSSGTPSSGTGSTK